MADSAIATIVDYTAAVAAEMDGVLSVWASGAGNVDDPLRPSQTIRAAMQAPPEEAAHWSELPSAPAVRWVTQDGKVELTWLIPMRLWLMTADMAKLREKALPWYPKYLSAFVHDRLLGGLVIRSWIDAFDLLLDAPVPNQARWGWLETKLAVIEQVDY